MAAAAAPALLAPPALFLRAFLQSHALTKERLLLGSPGGSVCPVGGPMTTVTCCGSSRVRASLVVLLAHCTHFPVTWDCQAWGGVTQHPARDCVGVLERGQGRISSPEHSL